MRSPRVAQVRQNPLETFRIHADHADGVSVPDLALKYALPAAKLLQILSVQKRASRLCTPHQVARGSPGEDRAPLATQIYWVGFAAACGRIYGRGTGAALVLTIREDQAGLVRQLITDLTTGHVGPDFCVSSRSGPQAYVRDGSLCDVLAAWGVPSPNPEEGSVPLELIPGRLMPHFVRGFLDGSAQETPGSRPRPTPRRSTQSHITLTGPRPLIEELAGVLHRQCQAKPSTLTPADSPGMVRLTYTSRKTCVAIRAFADTATAESAV